MRSLFKTKFLMQLTSLPISEPGRDSMGIPREKRVSALEGADSAREAGLGLGRRNTGGASRVPGAPLGGPLPAPTDGPSLHPWGGEDFSTGGRDSAQPFYPP